MIDTENIFNEIRDNLVLECPDNLDSSDLARMAQTLIEQSINFVSVPPQIVEILWAWMEGTKTKILTRFIIDNDCDISKLSGQVNSVFKKGASGAQIFIPYSKLSNFISELIPIRDDLFFNKTLSLCMNVQEINSLDWFDVFKQINDINADVLLLDFKTDEKNDFDFVGRIYGLMNALENNFSGELHFSLGNDYQKIEQVWRLANKMHPDIANKIRFFIKV